MGDYGTQGWDTGLLIAAVLAITFGAWGLVIGFLPDILGEAWSSRGRSSRSGALMVTALLLFYFVAHCIDKGSDVKKSRKCEGRQGLGGDDDGLGAG